LLQALDGASSLDQLQLEGRNATPVLLNVTPVRCGRIPARHPFAAATERDRGVMLKFHTGNVEAQQGQLPVDLTALSPIQVFERAARF
jgi:hypothetical protein